MSGDMQHWTPETRGEKKEMSSLVSSDVQRKIWRRLVHMLRRYAPGSECPVTHKDTESAGATMAATECGQETRGGHSWDIDTLLVRTQSGWLVHYSEPAQELQMINGMPKNQRRNRAYNHFHSDIQTVKEFTVVSIDVELHVWLDDYT